jgi:hypothetical protein
MRAVFRGFPSTASLEKAIMPLPYRLIQYRVLFLLLLALISTGYGNSQTFSTTGSMAEPLICQTATPLQNSMILIVGGTNGNYFQSGANATKDAEIYDPNQAALDFGPTGSLNVARGCGSTATLLNDGTVLITGGSGNTTAEIYIPSSGNFSLYTPPSSTHPQGLKIGPMNAVRYHATATLLQDGTVLIAGGDIGDNAGLTSAEIYNPATGTFTATTGSMSTRRTTQTATLLSNGTVLIAGGQGNYSGQVAWNTAETYNPSTQKFTLVGNMTTTRCQHTATLLTDGTVLLAGGQNTSGTTLSSAEIYTPSSSSFASTGTMTSSRIEHTATPLADGTVLIAGGFGSCGSGSNACITAEVYTPSSRTFAMTGNMTVPRAYHSATMIYNGDILIAGGEDMSLYASSILASAELYSYPVTTATILPAYRVTSIIYAPPGNKSQDGYTDTTTNSTTTTIGSSFATGSTLTMGFGITYSGFGVTASQSFATSSTSSSTSAFQETYTNATGVANQSNGSAVDAINHNNDLFLVWLNPELTVFGNESDPAGYNVGVQPLANGTTPSPDIVEVYASAMEANPANVALGTLAGASTVPQSLLNQISTPSGQYVPGLASICKNLIRSEYAAGTCTLVDQCGCTPADFLPILQTDPLLFYNGPTNPIAPYPATASPLAANTSSETVCGTLPVTVGSNCRYVPVPAGLEEPESSQQEGVTLEGPQTPGGNNPTNTFQQGENTQTTYTLGGQNQTTVGQSFNVTYGITGKGGVNGSLNWGLGKTMTWTDSQSVGTATGSGVSLSVTLSSSTLDCAQSNNVGVFEDTIYHTFVFQQPPADPSTCTTLTPAFYVTATPNNPSQTALSLGHSISYTVAASAWYGFNGTVALSISGLPAGVTARFSPAASITTSSVGTATLTLTSAYSSSTYIGNSTITVTGTSGSLTNSAVFPLTTQPLQYKGDCGVH